MLYRKNGVERPSVPCMKRAYIEATLMLSFTIPVITCITHIQGYHIQGYHTHTNKVLEPSLSAETVKQYPRPCFSGAEMALAVSFTAFTCHLCA